MAPPPDAGGEASIGVVNYFHIHDHAAVERVVDGLQTMGVTHVRSAVSWCDWETEGGPKWFEWVLGQLCSRFSVLPCVLYTPPAKGILPKTSSPPRDPGDYADFVDLLLTSYPDTFEYVELWNEPNNYIEWDWTVDPEWNIFATMIAGAAGRARSHGVKTVLGGMSPLDPNWLNLMFLRGAMEEIDVVGIHGFPGTWEAVWEGWGSHVDRVQEVLDRHSSDADVWITECGFSTWAHDEFRQLQTLADLLDAPVPRAYWYSAEDLDAARETLDGFHCDERAYHFGLHRRDGTPKLAARIWGSDGLGSVRRMRALAAGIDTDRWSGPATLVTGGAGAIGSLLVERLAADGRQVVVLDNLSRAGSEVSLRLLKERFGDLIRADVGDIRDPFAVRRALQGCDELFHLAAPLPGLSQHDAPLDLAVNLQGTMNLLEEIRRLEHRPALVFASTLDVYQPSQRPEPISEDHPLSFQGIGGCSKGGADQYVLRYGSAFGFPVVVFRLSLVEVPQARTEDRPPPPAPHEGMQIRDVLHVDDVVAALLLGMENHEVLGGGAYNVGGGPDSVVMLRPSVDPASAPATCTYLVADPTAFSDITGWVPRMKLSGVSSLTEEPAVGS